MEFGFYFLAIMNKIAINICLQIFARTCSQVFFLSIFKYLGRMVNLCLYFWGVDETGVCLQFLRKCQIVFKSDRTSNEEGSNVSTFLSALWVVAIPRE
jgi:hypothetical protein